MERLRQVIFDHLSRGLPSRLMLRQRFRKLNFLNGFPRLVKELVARSEPSLLGINDGTVQLLLKAQGRV